MRRAVHLRGVFAIIAGFLVGACETTPVAGTGASVVYGTDDRREVYATTPELRERARRSIVTIMWNTTPGGVLPSTVVPGPSTLVTAFGICPDEPFADQPVLGNCTGTLIDRDLVLTAGHCVPTLEQCKLQMFVFDYFYEAEGRLAPMTSEDVYGCGAIVAFRYVPEGAPQRRDDFAIVQLDRPVAPERQPVALADAPRVVANDPVAVISAGLSLPLKVDAEARVLDPGGPLGDFFLVSTDSFEGSSGAGVFDPAGRIVGVLVRGEEPSFAPIGRGECALVTQRPEGSGGAEASHAREAVRTLCSDGYPSEALCQRAPSCGDGFCTGAEDAATCVADCGTTRCGDLRCDPAERGRCGVDCGYRTTCGDGTCELGEPGACEADCPTPACGNDVCEPAAGEDPSTCGLDCPVDVCWNGRCEEWAGETPSTCGDCAGTCGDGVCAAAEDATSCPADCAPSAGRPRVHLTIRCATAQPVDTAPYFALVLLLRARRRRRPA